MEVSLLLMEQIAQLFIVLLMGYIVVKAKLLKPSDSKVLSVVFVYLIMPCVVLNAFQIDDTPELRAGLLYSMAIAVGMHVVFLAFDTVIRRPLNWMQSRESTSSTAMRQHWLFRWYKLYLAVSMLYTLAPLSSCS